MNPYREKEEVELEVPPFVQITADNSKVWALDKEGRVWQACWENGFIYGWFKIPTVHYIGEMGAI